MAGFDTCCCVQAAKNRGFFVSPAPPLSMESNLGVIANAKDYSNGCPATIVARPTMLTGLQLHNEVIVDIRIQNSVSVQAGVDGRDKL
ncbi:hypothetical protein [Actinoplanes sp. NPDC049316]|uniref:hypothetical protein n=1 Tax=Actinoplanes sp. NPDC049316 TaxID=3154727 RepID=UPI00341449F9